MYSVQLRWLAYARLVAARLEVLDLVSINLDEQLRSVSCCLISEVASGEDRKRQGQEAAKTAISSEQHLLTERQCASTCVFAMLNPAMEGLMLQTFPAVLRTPSVPRGANAFV